MNILLFKNASFYRFCSSYLFAWKKKWALEFLRVSYHERLIFFPKQTQNHSSIHTIMRRLCCEQSVELQELSIFSISFSSCWDLDNTAMTLKIIYPTTNIHLHSKMWRTAQRQVCLNFASQSAELLIFNLWKHLRGRRAWACSPTLKLTLLRPDKGDLRLLLRRHVTAVGIQFCQYTQFVHLKAAQLPKNDFTSDYKNKKHLQNTYFPSVTDITEAIT